MFISFSVRSKYLVKICKSINMAESQENIQEVNVTLSVEKFKHDELINNVDKIYTYIKETLRLEDVI